MLASHGTPNPPLSSHRLNPSLTIKTVRVAKLGQVSPKKQTMDARCAVMREKRAWNLTIVLSEVTLNHMLALGFLILTIACSTGAIMSLAFGALRLFPIPVAVELFLKSGGGSVLSGLLCIFMRRSHSH
jgi:hypothetical protein